MELVGPGATAAAAAQVNAAISHESPSKADTQLHASAYRGNGVWVVPLGEGHLRMLEDLADAGAGADRAAPCGGARNLHAKARKPAWEDMGMDMDIDMGMDTTTAPGTTVSDARGALTRRGAR